MRYRWRGPQPTEGEEQIANAPDGLFPLAPVSDAPAEQTRTNWLAVMPGQPVPMIGEDRYADEPLED
jgi:hypothetical protein